MRSSRRFQLIWAIIVGAIAGLVAVGFQAGLKQMEIQRKALIEWWLLHPQIPSLGYPVLAMGVIFLVAWITRTFSPEASGSGIPHIKGVLLGVRRIRAIPLLVVKFFGGLLAIGTGLSLGREGPTVQLGGTIGGMVAERMGLSERSGSLLIAVGAGAGLSAAFNAPLAGFLFVMEELHFEFAPLPYISALAASISGDMVSRLVSGQLPSLLVFSHSTPPLVVFPSFILLGALAGGLAVLFKKALIQGIRWVDHHSSFALTILPILAGAAAGVCAFILPPIVGGGHATLENILNGDFSLNKGLGLIFLLLAGKFLLTLLSYFARVPGGIFAPMLVIGGLLGYGLGFVQNQLFPGLEVQPAVFAVIGMASFFSGVVHAPLTGVVLILEMTNNFKLLFPMMAAALVAFSISEWWGEKPVYEALLNEELRRTGPPALLFQEPRYLHALVEADAEICEKRIEQVELPEGVLVVAISRRGQKFVPSGKTVLSAGDGLEIVISGEVSPCSQEVRELIQAKRRSDPQPHGGFQA